VCTKTVSSHVGTTFISMVVTHTHIKCLLLGWLCSPRRWAAQRFFFFFFFIYLLLLYSLGVYCNGTSKFRKAIEREREKEIILPEGSQMNPKATYPNQSSFLYSLALGVFFFLTPLPKTRDRTRIFARQRISGSSSCEVHFCYKYFFFFFFFLFWFYLRLCTGTSFGIFSRYIQASWVSSGTPFFY
jgi:hypothetical protein